MLVFMLLFVFTVDKLIVIHESKYRVLHFLSFKFDSKFWCESRNFEIIVKAFLKLSYKAANESISKASRKLFI